MQKEQESSGNAYRWWIRGAAALFVGGMVALAVMNLPRGFDTDLTKIGTGAPALVFVYDPNLVISNKQAEEMDKAREEVEGRILFLVADIGCEEAQRFMRLHQVGATEFLLFNAQGDLTHKSRALLSAEELLALFQQHTPNF